MKGYFIGLLGLSTLSVTFGDSSPRGGASGVSVKLTLDE